MKRNSTIATIAMFFFGFLFSHLAIGAEWNVVQGDTVWKILQRGCKVTPSMQKAKRFASAIKIANPDLIFIGTRIDVPKGCEVVAKRALSSAAIASALEAQATQMQELMTKVASLEQATTEIRSKLVTLKNEEISLQSEISQLNVQRAADLEVNRKLEGLLITVVVMAILGMCLMSFLSFMKKKKVSETNSRHEKKATIASLPTFETLADGLSFQPSVEAEPSEETLASEFAFLSSLRTGWITAKVISTFRVDSMNIRTASFWRVIPI